MVRFWSLSLLLVLSAACRDDGKAHGEVREADVAFDSRSVGDGGPADTSATDDSMDSLPGPDETDLYLLDAFEGLSPEMEGLSPEMAEVVEPSPVPSVQWFDELFEAGDADGMGQLLGLYDGPFCDGDVCVLITPHDGPSALHVRGEFNDWNEGDIFKPLELLPDYQYIRLEGLSFAGCVQYKLFASDEWFLDSLNRYIRFSDVAMNNTLCQADASRIALVTDVYSPQLDNHRSLYVYVPAAAFADPEERFPVIYMQDGFNVFDNPMATFGSWDVNLTVDELAASGEVQPVIIVGIDTSDRADEYIYAPLELELGDDVLVIEPKLDLYSEFLVEVVKPLIDDQFPTLPECENTCMAGSSFGGISSLHIGWHNAGVFGKVASLSGSYWIGEPYSGTEEHPSMRELLLAKPITADQENLTIYLDSGGANVSDDPYPYTDDGRMYTDWVRNTLIGLGFSSRTEYDDDGNLATTPEDFPPTADPALVPTLYWAQSVPGAYDGWADYLKPKLDLLHLVGEGHVHNEAAWKARFPAALRYLFPGPALLM